MPWYKIAYLPQVISDLAQIDTAMAQRLLDKTKWLASNAGNLRHDPAAADLCRFPYARCDNLAWHSCQCVG